MLDDYDNMMYVYILFRNNLCRNREYDLQCEPDNHLHFEVPEAIVDIDLSHLMWCGLYPDGNWTNLAALWQWDFEKMKRGKIYCLAAPEAIDYVQT